MPTVKVQTVRREAGLEPIVDKEEVLGYLKYMRTLPAAKRPGCVEGTYTVRENGVPTDRTVLIDIVKTDAMVSFMYLFGRRDSEFLYLRKSDVSVKTLPSGREVLAVMMIARKRRLKLAPKEKVIPYNGATRTFIDKIVVYLKTLPGSMCQKCGRDSVKPPRSYCTLDGCDGITVSPKVFPGRTRPTTVYRRKYSGGREKTYPTILGGSMSPWLMWRILNVISRGKAYPYIFRKTFNTNIILRTPPERAAMAPFDMQKWNDWSDIRPASAYVEAVKGSTASNTVWGE